MDEQDQIIEWMPFVSHLAMKVKERMMGVQSVTFDDLYSAGMYGLLKAIRKCTEEKTFKAYAAQKINGAILDYLRKVDHLTQEGRKKAKEADDEFILISIDSSCEWDDENLFIISIDTTEHKEVSEILKDCMGSLHPSDYSMIENLFMKEVTMTELSKEMNLSWSGLYLKKKRALKHLANLFKSKRIKEEDIL